MEQKKRKVAQEYLQILKDTYEFEDQNIFIQLASPYVAAGYTNKDLCREMGLDKLEINDILFAKIRDHSENHGGATKQANYSARSTSRNRNAKEEKLENFINFLTSISTRGAGKREVISDGSRYII